MSPKVPCEHLFPSSSPDHHWRAAAAAAAAPVPVPTSDAAQCKSRHLKQLEEEYQKLKAVVPSLRQRRRAKRVTIVNEAVKYIDKLHADLMEKMMQGKIPAFSPLDFKNRIPSSREIQTVMRRPS